MATILSDGLRGLIEPVFTAKNLSSGEYDQMSLEDTARKREAQRNTESERARQQKERLEEQFATQLAPLIAEFAAALRSRNVPLIPRSRARSD